MNHTKSILLMNFSTIKILTATTLVTTMLALSLVTVKASANSKEYKLKAAFLYQFAKFVSWPNTSSDNITIGIVGKHSFGSSIKSIEGKNIRRKKISIKLMDSASEIGSCCQIIYFSSNTDMIASVKKSVLTVGEGKEFTFKGGIIGFVKKGTKLKFVVNIEAAKKAGLKISSKLLKVAIILN